MSNKRYDVLVAQKGFDDKTYWNRIGVAFVNQSKGLNVKLFGLPTNGECVIMPHIDKDQDDGSPKKQEKSAKSTKKVESDETPPF